VFQGRISGLEAEYPQHGGSQILVLAEDRLQDLRMTRRTRVFEDMTDQDVLQQIAGEHSLTPQLSLSGPTHKVLAQVNQSDLAYIRERARSAGAEVWVEGTTLHAASRTDRDGGTINLAYGVNLLSFSVRADLTHQVTEVSVAGWDVAAKDAIEETADESTISAELNGGTSGASILGQAFAARKERVVYTVPLSGEEARAVAEARYREIARRFVTGSGVADGDARLRVGSTLTLSGLGSLFDGTYDAVRVRHTYDSVYGFRTEFDLERPGLGPAQP
jgi:phage protein D